MAGGKGTWLICPLPHGVFCMSLLLTCPHLTSRGGWHILPSARERRTRNINEQYTPQELIKVFFQTKRWNSFSKMNSRLREYISLHTRYEIISLHTYYELPKIDPAFLSLRSALGMQGNGRRKWMGTRECARNVTYGITLDPANQAARLVFYYFFKLLLFFFRATLVAYGSSCARGSNQSCSCLPTPQP